MKRIRVIKWVRYATVTALLMFLSLLIWANWEPKTYTEKHIPNDVQYVQLNTGQVSQPQLINELEQKISSVKGVSSCSYSKVAQTIGVMFRTSVLNTPALIKKVNAITGLNVSVKEIPTSGGCPVGGVKYFFISIKNALKFRA